ncbi:hypothetical protein FHX74_001050 [Friedmanniella endophytica]|uniref:DUF1707 domain-containing protein n=1 Tax=Microlunatus kandeliicorticis TaxID=1759536 RepID=A0A7W3IQN6_9ACTN|nr:DUF1707 domain-containing protein [Microlunatus kandeliicorticis]MBA8793445.1 hypothetical protein [Microlunatus kandeliicorticis]
MSTPSSHPSSLEPNAESSTAKPVAPTGPEAMRASDADRQQVADVLSSAYAEGRLTREEYDERLDQAMTARTFGELIPVTRDLVYAPGTSAPTPHAPATTAGPLAVDPTNASAEPERLVGIFGGATRSGRWRVRRQTQALALFGGIDLDLRDAVLESQTVEISGIWCFGGLDIKVPEGMEVRDQTVGIFGGSDVSHVAPPTPGAPTLVIKGVALFGGVSVKSVRPRNADGWSRGDSRAQRRLERVQRRLERHADRHGWH